MALHPNSDDFNTNKGSSTLSSTFNHQQVNMNIEDPGHKGKYSNDHLVDPPEILNLIEKEAVVENVFAFVG
jgi:hypothetical protein